MVPQADLWRNAGLICCALGGYASADPPSGLIARLGTLEVLRVSLAGMLFVALWLHSGEIIQLFRLG